MEIYARNQTGFVTEWTIWGIFHGRAALTVAEGRPNFLPGHDGGVVRRPAVFSAEEKLKHFILPDKLYLQLLAQRRLRKGEKKLHILPFIVPRGGTSIDIGTNKGLYSWLLSLLSDRAQAFKPNPKIYALLMGAVPANVATHEITLSNKNGEADLTLPIHRTGRYSNQGATLQTRKLGAEQDFGLVKVARKRIDDYEFTNVSFVKIDVEGYELGVLESAREILARERPALLIEIEKKTTSGRSGKPSRQSRDTVTTASTSAPPPCAISATLQPTPKSPHQQLHLPASRRLMDRI